MLSHLRANLWLLVFTMLIGAVVYPSILLGIGQTVFSDQAEGSLVPGAGGKIVGSRLIAQSFEGDEYFQPRPSAASYKANASGASNYGANNYLLRDRVARQLGPIVRYGSGAEKAGKMPGQLVGPDIDAWFQEDHFKDKDGKTQSGIVAQWAVLHPGLAEAWIKDAAGKLKDPWKEGDKDRDPIESFLLHWQEDYPDLYKAWMKSDGYAEWKKKSPNLNAPPAADLVPPFFKSFSEAHPGFWPYVAEVETKDKQKRKKITRVKEAGKRAIVRFETDANNLYEIKEDQTEIQSAFFDTWRNEHPDVPLEEVPADMVMASGSGLDPHITLANALYQLKYRVAGAHADKLIEVRGLDKATAKEKAEAKIRHVLEKLLLEHKEAPLAGLVGVDLVNVLEINQAMATQMETLTKEYR